MDPVVERREPIFVIQFFLVVDKKKELDREKKKEERKLKTYFETWCEHFIQFIQ